MAFAPKDGQRPSKRARLLSDDEDSGSESSAVSSSSNENIIEADDDGAAFKINSEYAKRFEHNKKREELHRLEEKYGKDGNQDAEEDEDDSDEESEDDDAELATHELDDEIAATLQAIKSKDKRLYDKDNIFYKSLDRNDGAGGSSKKAKPVTLQDYHRQNLLSGAAASGADEEDEGIALTGYAEERTLKKNLLNAAHAQSGNSESEAEGEFFQRRPGQEPPAKRPTPPPAPLGTANAERDPETFLSNFMSSRAWVPDATSKWKAFESDDEDDDVKADKFEDAYNMRFEDPGLANQTLLSHSRKAVADYSVRRDKANPRKRARENERARRDEERRERDQEKTRLRNLKLEKASEKLRQFKDAAGVRAKGLDMDEWNKFLDAGWDSDKWDDEMQRRFGDQYYADKDDSTSLDGGESTGKKSKKKPKWNDDIDIDDIVPDFKQDDEGEFSLSEDDAQAEREDDEEEAETNGKGSKKVKGNDAKARAEKQRAKRKERRQLEELVDKSVSQDMLPASKKRTGPFRYRDASPTSFGLSSRDILMADDAALNQFAGLKKLASFRDAERKRRDAKKLGKSAHLRQWRKETFGDEQGPNRSFQEHIGSQMPKSTDEPQDADGADAGVDIVTAQDKKKSKKRSRKRKVGVEA